MAATGRIDYNHGAMPPFGAAHGQVLKILSIAFPFANSSTNLSR
jgi:hypothetical protein